MNTAILVLIFLAIAVLAVWIYLIGNLVRDTKSKRTSKRVSDEAAHLSRQAKIEAQERMTKAVEKEYANLQKSLQAEADNVSSEFKKSIHEITSKNLKEFNSTLQQINTSMKKEVKVLAEASQKQSLLTKKSLDAVVKALPALRNPTISQLSNADWIALETIIDESVVREIIPQLKARGAEGIVEYPLNKVVY